MTAKFILYCIAAALLAPFTLMLSFLLLIPAYKELQRSTQKEADAMLNRIHEQTAQTQSAYQPVNSIQALMQTIDPALRAQWDAEYDALVAEEASANSK